MTVHQPRKALAGDAVVVVIMAPLREATAMSRPVRRAARLTGYTALPFCIAKAGRNSSPTATDPQA
jgi:hypothetical protein